MGINGLRNGDIRANGSSNVGFHLSYHTRLSHSTSSLLCTIYVLCPYVMALVDLSWLTSLPRAWKKCIVWRMKHSADGFMCVCVCACVRYPWATVRWMGIALRKMRRNVTVTASIVSRLVSRKQWSTILIKYSTSLPSSECCEPTALATNRGRDAAKNPRLDMWKNPLHVQPCSTSSQRIPSQSTYLPSLLRLPRVSNSGLHETVRG